MRDSESLLLPQNITGYTESLRVRILVSSPVGIRKWNIVTLNLGIENLARGEMTTRS